MQSNDPYHVRVFHLAVYLPEHAGEYIIARPTGKGGPTGGGGDAGQGEGGTTLDAYLGGEAGAGYALVSMDALPEGFGNLLRVVTKRTTSTAGAGP